MKFKSLYSEIQDTQVVVLHQDVSVHQPSALSDLLGDNTSMGCRRRQGGRGKGLHESAAGALDTDPLMWLKQHVQEFPHLARMTRKYLAVPATSATLYRRLRDSLGQCH